MRLSQFPLFTTKETPADAEIVSHRLMLRAGMIRRVSSGLYTWMPLGLKVLRKVERIVREEMDRSGAIELLMPGVQPAELWLASGRWEAMGPELLRFTDRHERWFCLGPTHEEVITQLVGQEIKSYRQLPVNFYQIQWKFRDEIRPRFGVMRAREFLMKDAYSFNLGAESLVESYESMRVAYQRVFERIGVDFRIVVADSGNIGGSRSEEFHVLAQSGEDLLAVSDDGDYAANVEAAVTAAPSQPRPDPSRALEKVATPGVHTIAELSSQLDVPASRCLKTLLVAGTDGHPVALVLRGDHELNELKAIKHPAVADPLTLAGAEQVKAVTGAGPGSVGPRGLDIKVIADFSAAAATDWACGANEDGYHLTGVNWGRDLPEPESADLRMVVEGDPSPDGRGRLRLVRGIEVGHIFQLGRKYSEALDIKILDQNGREAVPDMGCYGIGVSRVVAAVIEQSHDDDGIVWPEAVAPFELVLVPINLPKSPRVRDAADTLYRELREAGVEVVLDDRGLRPGVMFADADLIGIPHRIVLSERGLDAGRLEYKARHEGEAREIEFSAQAALAQMGRQSPGQLGPDGRAGAL